MKCFLVFFGLIAGMGFAETQAQVLQSNIGWGFGVSTTKAEIYPTFQFRENWVIEPSFSLFWRDDNATFHSFGNRASFQALVKRYKTEAIFGWYVGGLAGANGFDFIGDDIALKPYWGGAVGYDHDGSEIDRILLEVQAGTTLTGRAFVGLGVKLIFWGE